MKKQILSLGLALSAPLVWAGGTASTTTTAAEPATVASNVPAATSRSGMITSFTAGASFSIKSDDNASTYKLGKSVSYVDAAGNAVDPTMLKPGLPITVQYEKVDADLVASKITVDQQ